MPVEIQPPELASLIDLAERPRADDWSLRAALVRYAQPEPQRVSNLLEQVRRIETALHANHKAFEHDGPELWSHVTTGTAPAGPAGLLVALLHAVEAVDAVGDALATWAADRSGPRPDAAVDACVTDVARMLDEIGVPREEVPPGPPRRGGERRR